jgi:CHAT domain-containing protein
MNLISSSISFLLAVAYPVAIAQQVVAQQNVSTFDIAQTRNLVLENALNRGDMKEIVPQIEATWENQYETYFKTNFVNRTISDRTVSSTLNRIARTTGKKTALVYLFPGEQQLDIIVVFPGRKSIHQRVKQANRQALQAKLKEFKNTLTIPSQRNTNRYLPVSKQLYQWIIAPIEADLKAQKIDTLMFCVGVGLRTTPIAALHDGQQFLVEKYSIGRIPAFKLTDATYTSVKNAPILAMGASEFSNQNSLPGVPLELSLVTQHRRQNRAFLNREFTLKNLQSQLQKQPFRVLHLATHANFQSGTPSNSYVQFWNTRLRLNQVKQLGWQKIPVELLVLSACETAIGDRDAELGFAGLAVNAGVKSAIASLWFVSDEGTLALMSELYRQLRTSPIKAEALRQAQISMIRGKVRLENGQLRTPKGNIKLPPQLANLEKRNLAHPYYWSAFTIVGSPW